VAYDREKRCRAYKDKEEGQQLTEELTSITETNRGRIHRVNLI